MPSRLLATIATAACAGFTLLAAAPALAQSQAEGAKSTAAAKPAKTAAATPARQALTAATATTGATAAAKPAAAQSKSPEPAPKADAAWKSNCSHAKDSDA